MKSFLNRNDVGSQLLGIEAQGEGRPDARQAKTVRPYRAGIDPLRALNLFDPGRHQGSPSSRAVWCVPARVPPCASRGVAIVSLGGGRCLAPPPGVPPRVADAPGLVSLPKTRAGALRGGFLA